MVLLFPTYHRYASASRLIRGVDIPRAVEAEKPRQKCTIRDHKMFPATTKQTMQTIDHSRGRFKRKEYEISKIRV